MLHGMLRAEGVVENRKANLSGVLRSRYAGSYDAAPQVDTASRFRWRYRHIRNERWSADFVHDQLADGRRIRVLNIVDDFSRGCALVSSSTCRSPEPEMVRLLDELRETRGLPKTLVLDNGLEMTSKAMFFWSRQHRVKLHFIQPGKPTQNAFIESFTRSLPRRLSESTLVQSISPMLVRSLRAWHNHYNTVRPHSFSGLHAARFI
jgi:putative transposase